MKPKTLPLRSLSSAPRAHLFTLRTRLHTPVKRYSTSALLQSNDKPPSASPSSANPLSFARGPSPPRLPKEEQEIFEALQRSSTGAFSTPRTPAPRVNQSPDSSAQELDAAQEAVRARIEKMQGAGETRDGGEGLSESKFEELYDKVIEARGDGEELHPNVVRGARPEFEGDINPKTGEVGGPKNEPLRWGAAGEWSYNGRTTDF